MVSIHPVGSDSLLSSLLDNLQEHFHRPLPNLISQQADRGQGWGDFFRWRDIIQPDEGKCLWKADTELTGFLKDSPCRLVISRKYRRGSGVAFRHLAQGQTSPNIEPPSDHPTSTSSGQLHQISDQSMVILRSITQR
jgi:hypothetical protein